MLEAPPARQALPTAALALAGAAGVAGALQARVNGELRVAVEVERRDRADGLVGVLGRFGGGGRGGSRLAGRGAAFGRAGGHDERQQGDQQDRNALQEISYVDDAARAG